MEPTGDRLRRAREAKRMSLRDVALATKISISALEAIERNDFSRVAGGIYGRSFVRAYAELLELPADETVDAFAIELAQQQRDKAKKQARPTVTAGDREFLAKQERAMKFLRAGAIALGLAVIVALVWFGWSRVAGREEPVDESPNVSLPVSAVPAPAPPAEAPAEPAAELMAISTPTPERIAIEVRPSGDCWLNVTADGKVVLDRVIKAGETLQFSAEHELQIDAGNAGVLDWSINGRPARLLGARNQHRRATITRENAASFQQ